MDSLISIIVPVYNVELYLNECINSIRNQTYKNLEIILIDDGSTDNSGKICDEYAKIDSRIVVIHKENKGVTSARKVGVEIANGKYIGFVDSDDYIDKEMYKNMLKKILETDADFIDCGCIRFSDSNNIYYPKNFYRSDIELNEMNRDNIMCQFITNRWEKSDDNRSSKR